MSNSGRCSRLCRDPRKPLTSFLKACSGPPRSQVFDTIGARDLPDGSVRSYLISVKTDLRGFWY
jgi:hypothetical protein